MEVHPLGKHIMGGIDESVHVDLALLSERVPELRGRRSGGWKWLTDIEVGGPVEANPTTQHYELWAVNLQTNKKRTLDDNDGANVFFAGGSVWAAGLDKPDGKRWYRDSFGREIASATPLGVDNLSGRVALALGYPDRITFAVASGADLGPVGAVLDSLSEVSFRDGVLMFRSVGRLKLWRDGVVTDAPIQAPMPGVRSTVGRYVLGYKDGLGDVVYDIQTGLGFPLHAAGSTSDTYDHDENGDLALRPEDGRIVVATAWRAGERPEEVRSYVIDVSAMTVNGEARQPIDVMASGSAVPPIAPATPRNIWRGMDSKRVVPGNVVWGGNASDARVRHSGMPYALNESNVKFMLFSPRENNIYGSPDEQAVAIVEEIAKLQAQGHRCCVLVYPDRRPFDLYEWLKWFRDQNVVAIVAPNWYPVEGKSASQCFDDQTSASIVGDLKQIREHGEHSVGPYRAVYTQQHAWDLQDVWDLLGMTDTLIESDHDILCDFLFGDGRPGGSFSDWPEIQSWYADRCRGLKADAPFPSGAVPPEDKPMTQLYVKTRNGLYVGSRVQDGTRRLFAIASPDEFCVWKPILTRGTKVGETDSAGHPINLVYFDLVNFPGNPIGVSRYDAVGEQAACAIRSGTQFTNGRGDDNDWTFETEPPAGSTHAMRLVLRQDLQNGIYLEKFESQAASLGSFRFVERKADGTEGKVFTEPFR